jgi:hypothetical protein
MLDGFRRHLFVIGHALFVGGAFEFLQILFGQSVIGIELKRVFEVRLGFGEASHLGEGASQVRLGVGVVGLQLQG